MKKICKIMIVTILLYMCFAIFMNVEEVTNSVIFSFDIWKNNIFPSLFPFFVISNILINYGFIAVASKILKPLTKLFKVSDNAAFVIVMGLLSGFPSSAKYVKELVDKEAISPEEASKILTFTHFSNPLFIINTIGYGFLGNPKIGIYILIIHYFTNMIIGLLFRNYKVTSHKNNVHMSEKEASLGKVITSSIIDSVNTLLLILGTVSFFLVITTVINNSIHLSSINSAIINGIIEMTQGLKYVGLLNNSLKVKAILSIMMISFGGISVHIQTFSIISERKINYIPFLIARILHAIISGILMLALFRLFPLY